jgi:hypothetical protein
MSSYEKTVYEKATARLFQLPKNEKNLHRCSWSRVIGNQFKSSQVNTLPKAKSQAKDKRAKDRQ